MNTIAPSRMADPIMVICPVWTCRAKPGYSCINQQGDRLKHPHKLRVDKSRTKRTR
jgi:hypothetical protein